MPHLRLVASNAQPAPTSVPVPASCVAASPVSGGHPSGEQLGFDFLAPEEPKRRIFLVAMDSIHGRTFTDLIDRIRPHATLDTRYAVRFDLPGATRSSVFGRFSSMGTLYYHSSLLWHELSQKDFMSGEMQLDQRLHHELIENDQSPVLVLVPKLEHAKMLSVYLNRRLSERRELTWQLDQVM